MDYNIEGSLFVSDSEKTSCMGCSVSGATITADGTERHSVGGIVGYINGELGTGECEISGCSFSGNINPGTNKYVGGVVGRILISQENISVAISGCKISNTKINGEGACSCNGGVLGIAQCTESGTIEVKNNEVSNFTISSENNYLAGIAGIVKMEAINCTFTAERNKASEIDIDGKISGHVGGFMGCANMNYSSDSISIDSFIFDGTINASKHMVGGVVGDNDFADDAQSMGNLAISNCTINGDLTGNYYVGGAIGLINIKMEGSKFSIINTAYTGGNIICKSNGGSYSGVGGIVGYATLTATATLDIYNCYSRPTSLKVDTELDTSKTTVGGIISVYKNLQTIDIYNCYSDVSLDKIYVDGKALTEPSTYRIGGIFGLLAPKKKTYAKVTYVYYDNSLEAGVTATSTPTIVGEAYDFTGDKTTLVDKLNANVDSYTGTYVLRKWELGTDGYPTFVSE